MVKLVAIAVGVLAIVVAGAVAYLMVWDVPVPATHVERVIPDARFPR